MDAFYNKAHRNALGHASAKAKDLKKEEHNNDKYHKKAFKSISGPGSPPLLFVERPDVGPQGQPKGSIATDPREVDSIFTRAWQAIYKGNVSNPMEHAGKFLDKYSKWLFSSDAFELGKLDPQDLMDVCVNGSMTAAGLDGWSPKDWSILPYEAFVDLALLLDAIEDGCLAQPIGAWQSCSPCQDIHSLHGSHAAEAFAYFVYSVS